MTHLEETIPKTSFQSNSVPSGIGDIRKGQHEAPTLDPGDGEFREAGSAHRPEGTEPSLSPAPHFTDRNTAAQTWVLGGPLERVRVFAGKTNQNSCPTSCVISGKWRSLSVIFLLNKMQ